MKLMDWANDIRSAVGLGPDKDSCSAKGASETQREERRDVHGRKVVLRQRRALGIMHLRDISSKGGCGLTDMPLAVGSLVFVELTKPHFWAAEVRWVRSMSIGLEFFRPVRPEMLARLNQPAPADSTKPKRGAGRNPPTRPAS